MSDGCPGNYYTKEHSWSPWVQERWRPTKDTRVCRFCSQYEARDHVEGTSMFAEELR